MRKDKFYINRIFGKEDRKEEHRSASEIPTKKKVKKLDEVPEAGEEEAEAKASA